MKTIIETIKNLDKDTAKDLKLIAENSYEYTRELNETPEKKEQLFNILDMIISTTKARVKKLAELEIESN